MKIMINISEELYNRIASNKSVILKRKVETVERAVLNGTLLPKEHDGLIGAQPAKEGLFLNTEYSYEDYYVHEKCIHDQGVRKYTFEIRRVEGDI